MGIEMAASVTTTNSVRRLNANRNQRRLGAVIVEFRLAAIEGVEVRRDRIRIL
jgi:hypothetical protein